MDAEKHRRGDRFLSLQHPFLHLTDDIEIGVQGRAFVITAIGYAPAYAPSNACAPSKARPFTVGMVAGGFPVIMPGRRRSLPQRGGLCHEDGTA